MTRFVALAIISAAILAYEVLLTRLFAIVQWHHFAFMAISIALLGFGVSAAVLAVGQRFAAMRMEAIFWTCATAFAVLAPAAFLAAQHIPFNALELVWEPAQLLNLGAIYLILTVPFIVGAACICVAFMRPGDAAGRVYFWNLLGSAAGALLVVLSLSLFSPADNLWAVAALGLVAAALALVGEGGSTRRAVAALILAVGAVLWLVTPASWLSLKLAEQKGLSVALTIDGAQLADERFGPLGLVSVVESPRVPFRSAAGLSLLAPAPPPEQVALFTDADAMTTIDARAGREPAAYLGYMTGALVYALTEAPRVLVLDAGGGRQVAQALALGARAVDAVEPNADVVAIVGGTYGTFAGGLYGRDDVRVHIADPRGYLAATGEVWDVIVVDAAGAGGSGAGAHGLNEDYLLTVEAVTLMLRRLAPGGWLSFSQTLRLPPRDAPKLILTALEALERLGADRPGDHLILIRGTATTTLLVGREPVGADDIAVATAFVQARAFDLAFYPGMTRGEANRVNVLAEPAFFDAATALTGSGRDDFVDRYKFDIAPATDDRPYFHDFFRWRSLPELLAMRTAGGAALLELGKPILIATLVQALVISLVLILVPLLLGGLARGRGALVRSTGAYFAAIGVAFFFVEIAFIQKFILFLGHPTYAIAVVLAGFLVFAGCGAWVSERLAHLLPARPARAVGLAVSGIVLVAVAYLFGAPLVFETCAGLPVAGRALVALALIAPLGFFMGMPFPLGLTLVKRADERLTAWAWGVNGCASVTSAILAVLLAMHVGYAAVVVIALVLYVLAARAVRGVALKTL